MDWCGWHYPRNKLRLSKKVGMTYKFGIEGAYAWKLVRGQWSLGVCLNCCCVGSCDRCTFGLLVNDILIINLALWSCIKYNMAANCHCTDFGFGLICRIHRGAYPCVLRRRRAIQLQPWGSLWLTWLDCLPSAVCACAPGRHSLDWGRPQVHRQRLAECTCCIPPSWTCCNRLMQILFHSSTVSE